MSASCDWGDCKPLRITEQAHLLLRSWIKPGDIAVDATCGNGKDTALLVELCGAGTVYACDIQQQALDSTRCHLEKTGSVSTVRFVQGCHSQWDQLLPSEHKGKIKIFVYNLGYLPHGNKALTTRAKTTIESVEQALDWVGAEAAILVVAYPGHSTGLEELEAFLEWCHGKLPKNWKTTAYKSSGRFKRGPELYWLQNSGENFPTCHS